MITLWYGKLWPGERLADVEKYIYELPPVLQQRVLLLKRVHSQKARLLGYLLLQHALRHEKLEHLLQDITYSPDGRPYLDTTLDFNISHSEDYAICAISHSGKVGVDIECIKTTDLDALRSHFLGSAWSKLNSFADLHGKFYSWWTQKESVAKADGRGLNLSFEDIQIANNEILLHGTPWYLREILLIKNYVVHIASDHPIKD